MTSDFQVGRPLFSTERGRVPPGACGVDGSAERKPRGQPRASKAIPAGHMPALGERSAAGPGPRPSCAAEQGLLGVRGGTAPLRKELEEQVPWLQCMGARSPQSTTSRRNPTTKATRRSGQQSARGSVPSTQQRALRAAWGEPNLCTWSQGGAQRLKGQQSKQQLGESKLSPNHEP